MTTQNSKLFLIVVFVLAALTFVMPALAQDQPLAPTTLTANRDTYEVTSYEATNAGFTFHYNRRGQDADFSCQWVNDLCIGVYRNTGSGYFTRDYTGYYCNGIVANERIQTCSTPWRLNFPGLREGTATIGSGFLNPEFAATASLQQDNESGVVIDFVYRGTSGALGDAVFTGTRATNVITGTLLMQGVTNRARLTDNGSEWSGEWCLGEVPFGTPQACFPLTITWGADAATDGVPFTLNFASLGQNMSGTIEIDGRTGTYTVTCNITGGSCEGTIVWDDAEPAAEATPTE